MGKQGFHRTHCEKNSTDFLFSFFFFESSKQKWENKDFTELIVRRIVQIFFFLFSFLRVSVFFFFFFLTIYIYIYANVCASSTFIGLSTVGFNLKVF
jgi:hypothetical protein